MKHKKPIATILSFVLTISIFTIALPEIGYSQAPASYSVSKGDLESRLSQIEAKVVKRQKELEIPGVSLAIVKDGKVIYSKGLGYKDFEKKIPITADTQLAIGSATKAFTGLSVLMLQDEGKLSLKDSPKKYLPYFRINNPETDKNIQLIDLLTHSSGLNRTDLAFITGKLNRVELIKVAGNAKPMAGLREKFFYQNIMFTAAGEIVSEIYGKPWKRFVPEKIFSSLGMNNSTMTVKEMQKSKDFSFGYDFNFDTRKTRKLPTRDIVQVAPAGSINSSANDMAKWLKFILACGELDGKRLVSEKGFKQWLTPHMKITPNGKVSYGLGWFVQDWKGKKVVQHGGNIDGFNSMVAMLPEENIGFVMLTNVSASSLGNELMQIVWSGLLEDVSSKKLPDGAKEVGKYKFLQAGFDIEVAVEDGKLVAKVPGQPTYILEKVKDRRYRLSNAPAGFFITFKDTEAFLEQPQGNFNLPKEGTKPVKKSAVDRSASELIGIYEAKAQKGNTIEIKDVEGKPSLVVGEQPPYPLEKRDDGNFGSPKLPPVYYVKVKHDSNGKVAGFTMVQPEGEFEFTYIGKKKSAPEIAMSVDDLMAKTINALGGEENMRKINSRAVTFEIDAVHQGVKGYGKSYAQTPNKAASKTTITALGKKIGRIDEYFDGTKGGEKYSFSRDEKFTGKRLEDIKVSHRFHPFLESKTFYKSIKIIKTEKVNGEKAYVVSFQPKNASKFTVYISAKTYLPVKRNSIVLSSTSSQRIPLSETYSDYKRVDGLMIPFKLSATSAGMGTIITHIKEVKHNVKIPGKTFVSR
ncbi:MAG: serine hydrolase [Pyrinomonadaceae bacterium]|nr:serine hydrolase [Pyrinomonadaceae bacterium]